MTRYSRSVIPGRSNGDGSNPAEIDRLVFGQKGRSPSADNDVDDDDDDDDDDDIDDSEAAELKGRANKERRSKVDRRVVKSRRKAEFTPLPMEGGNRKYRSPDDNRRGAVLLMGAAAVVGVFGLVVWNAYREGVRPQDSNTAPLLETSGSFKSKPEETTGAKSAAEEASVFEQVEAPRPNVEPTPEVRPEIPPVETAVAPPPAAPAPKLVETKAAPASAAPKSAETKPVETKIAETKPAQVAAAPASPKADAPISLTPKPAVAAPHSGAFKPSFAADGKFAVQIAAGATEAAAVGEWNKHVKFSPELFADAERLVVQAEVNGKTVYRLRAGSFASSADADAFCSAFKAKGGACFRVAK
jgi:outer membrane biosynthesis protein TonB